MRPGRLTDDTLPDNVQLTLLVRPQDADLEELDETTRQLRTELQQLPVDAVSLAAGPAPAVGAKVGDPVTLGALTLSLAPIVIPAVLEFLKSWMGRKEGRSVVIRAKVGDSTTEIEIKAPISQAEISALVEQLSPKIA